MPIYAKIQLQYTATSYGCEFMAWGEVGTPGHEGWTEIIGISHELKSPPDVEKRTGDEDAGTLIVRRRCDAVTPKLQQYAISGKSPLTWTIDFLKGDAATIPYMRITLRDVRLAHYRMSALGRINTESIDLIYRGSTSSPHMGGASGALSYANAFQCIP